MRGVESACSATRAFTIIKHNCIHHMLTRTRAQATESAARQAQLKAAEFEGVSIEVRPGNWSGMAAAAAASPEAAARPPPRCTQLPAAEAA